jgi:hypothetical protein
MHIEQVISSKKSAEDLGRFLTDLLEGRGVALSFASFSDTEEDSCLISSDIFYISKGIHN